MTTTQSSFFRSLPARQWCICLACIGLGWIRVDTLCALTLDGRNVPLVAEAGDGASLSYLLIDFGGAKPPGGQYAFAFHYDGNKTGQDLLAAVDSEAEALTVEYQDFGTLGSFVSTITVNEDTDTPDFGVDQRYWVYWLGTYHDANGGQVAWESSLIGIGDRQLSNGSIDGWYASTGEFTPRFPLDSLVADLNQDGAVDAADASLMFADWGPGASRADFTQDLFVDAADAAVMFAQWTGDTGPHSAVPEPSAACIALGIVLFAWSMHRRGNGHAPILRTHGADAPRYLGRCTRS